MLKRTVLQTSTLVVVAAAVFAACSDNTSVAPKPGIAKPLFSATTPFNNDGQCMYQDAVRAPDGTIAGVKNGSDPASAANCSSNDVNIATADLKFFSIADAQGNFGPPVAYTGQAVMCPEGRAIQLTMAARLDETASSQRFDIGIWLATDGGNAKIGACKHFNLIAGGSVTDEDGDSCGDLNNSASVASFELGTFNTVCEVNSDPTKATNSLHVGSCLGWTEPGANRVCPLPGVAGPDGFRFGTLPGNQSKCNCEGFDVPIVIQKTAKLEVTKSCSPVNDNGTFDLLIDGSTTVNGSIVGNDKTCGTGTGAQVLGAGTNTNPGAVHSFGEGDFTTANYTSAYACTNRSATGPQHVFTASGDAAATGSSLGPNQITLQPGEDVVCAYTNTRKASVELKKVWSGSPGQTTLNIGTTAGGSEVKSQQTGANGAAPLTTGTQVVSNGAYFFSETGGLTDYSSSLTCTVNGTNTTPGLNNSITASAGDVVICTFTNTRNQGTIELKKAWSGTAGQTTLNIGTTAGGSEVKSQQTGANGAAPLTTGAQTVNTGTYYVSETGGLTDYSSSLACTDNGSSVTPGGSNSLSVANGHTVVCTFTNTRNTGTIELKKVWSGTAGQTTLNVGTTANASDVKSQLTGANGAAPLTTGTQTVNTGTYYVSETGGLTDYGSSLACTDNGSSVTPGASNSLPVATGHAVICTFTNTRNTGTIELRKVWSGTAGQTTLNIGTTAGGSDVKSQLTGANGGAPLTTGSQAVNTATYYVSETGGLTNYSSSLACTDNGSSVTPGAYNSVPVATGHAVICTFTNTRDQGSIELQKEWVGPGGQTTLNIGTTAGGSETKSQQTGAAGAAPLTTGAQTVNTGTYYVSETGGLTDYSSSLACTDNGSSVTPGTNNSVSVLKSHAVVCKFTNSRKARLTVQKVVVGGGTQSFEFARNGTIFNLLNGGSLSTGFTLSAGKYTVCEDALAVAWHAIASLDGTSVTLYNPDAQSQQDLGNRCFDINLQFGDDKTIVFTNSPPPGGDARTIGYWKNWSSCTGGQQYTKALQKGTWNTTLDGNLPQTVGVLTLQGASGANQTAAGCANAVNILNKSDLSGTKRASDPAYNMAAQLLAAMLNRHAGAGAVCNIDQLITDAQALLVQIGFNGVGASSLSGKTADKTLVAKAQNFATLLDAYNNNNCTDYVP